MADYNAIVFQTALRSTNVPTFYEARAVLAEIDMERISDPDVEEYVKFCKDLSQYAIDHGIQRSADLNIASVLKTADHGKTATTLLGRWWQEGVVGPIKSGLEGGWLAMRLRGWFALQERLATKYL